MAKKRIANDGVAYLLGRYHEGTKSIEELAIELQDKYLDQQYFFDERCLTNKDLTILVFPPKATLEWALFIDRNRSRQHHVDKTVEDIVIGPIANDGVAYLLERFHEATKTIEELAIELQDKYLDQQYYFGTERALTYLKRTNVISL